MRLFHEIYLYDCRMLLWCEKSRSYPHIIKLARAFSRSGDGYMQLLLPIAIAIFDPPVGGPFLLVLAVAFAIERPLYYVLKNTLRRQRPPRVVASFHSIVHAADEFSFPSGHTMAAFLLAGTSALTFGVAAAPLYFWAAAVGVSRVILGVHFPSDILAGATLGSALAMAVASHL